MAPADVVAADCGGWTLVLFFGSGFFLVRSAAAATADELAFPEVADVPVTCCKIDHKIVPVNVELKEAGTVAHEFF